MNPTLSNLHATCVECPYTSNFDPDGNPLFFGLLYDGSTHLLDGDADGSYMQIGASSSTMLGPQEKNDDGLVETPMIVELYVRPDPSGDICIDCRACFDEDGYIRKVTYEDDGTESNACPDYCVEDVGVSGVGELPRPNLGNISSVHKLVMATNGLAEAACESIISYDSIESSLTNTSICEGKEEINTEAAPDAMRFGRIGGIVTRAFFVAPVDGNYTFHANFDDGGEIFMSENADPRKARLILSVDDSSSSSNIDEDWCKSFSCSSRSCFRKFGGHYSFSDAKRACLDIGGALGAPRSSSDQSLLESMLGDEEMWIGVSDSGSEDSFFYTDGSHAGVGNSVRLSCITSGRCFAVTTALSTFESAPASCQRFGAEFAVPTNQEENMLIASILQDQSISAAWIALDDRQEEGNWTFSDGSRAGVASPSSIKGWDYENFGNNQPDVSFTEEIYCDLSSVIYSCVFYINSMHPNTCIFFSFHGSRIGRQQSIA